MPHLRLGKTPEVAAALRAGFSDRPLVDFPDGGEAALDYSGRNNTYMEVTMRAIVLWLLGIPISMIVLLYLFGALH